MNAPSVSVTTHFASWELFKILLRSVGIIHFEFVVTGDGQLRSAVLSGNLSFVSTEVTGEGIECLEGVSSGAAERHGRRGGVLRLCLGLLPCLVRPRSKR